MDSHIVGSSSTPPENGGSAQSEGTSFAVLQWIALMRGEWRVQEPRNRFRVETVTCNELYCLRCCGVRAHDVIQGFAPLSPSTATSPQMGERNLGGSARRMVTVCRCCGEEVAHG